MEKCLICGYESVNTRGLGIHVRITHGIGSKEYYDRFFKKDGEGICQECGKETRYSSGLGYLTFCSTKCAHNSGEVKERRRLTNIQKYGGNSPMASKEVKDKVKKTNFERTGYDYPMQNPEYRNKIIEKYGVDNISKLDEIKEKKKQTTLENFGVENPFQSPEIREKAMNTIREIYGVDNVKQNEEIKERGRQTCLERYGFENPLQNEDVKEKAKQTNLSRYGAEHFSQTEAGKEKYRETCLERYGVETTLELDSVKQKSKETSLEKFGTEFYQQSEQGREVFRRLMVDRLSSPDYTATGFSFVKIKLKKFDKIYKSSWEAIFQLENPKYEYETLRLKYIDPITKKDRVYIVDFIDRTSKSVVEVKASYFMEECAHKIEVGKKWCEENGYTFSVLSNDWFKSLKIKEISPDEIEYVTRAKTLNKPYKET